MRLVVVEEGLRSKLEFSRGVIRIGRAIDNDIRLSAALASRHHCRIEILAEEANLFDLGSANGTQVNGTKIQRKLLSKGDLISVGGARLHVESVFELDDPNATQRLDPSEVEEMTGGGEPPEFGAAGLSTLSGEIQRERDNLRVFSRIARALLQETELTPLLRLIVDSAIHLIGGERGFVLLSRKEANRSDPGAADGQMRVSVARSFDRSDIPIPATRISMGIAERVVEGGRPLLSVDAGRDERFAEMPSVEDLKLRSVMCLPIHIEGRTDGVLYVDNRLQQGAFTEDDLDLAELFADQAAMAIRNARMVAELRARNRRLLQSSEEIKHLNGQLGRKIRDRDSELAVVRAELGRERGRYDYSQIVGASDGMRKVFKELDRIVETELPVFVQGESGTGKELIARAIHFNGARKEKPFVVENCAALPDTLLESELFGHTRGAFTGADRAKKGLIEQADGGTLFLDEIGDMSAEMQKKLLRVLQEGEVRPLGSDRAVKVDVRLLAASHRDLEELVKKSEFREDLFYRINVLTLRIPPLRERRDDIPLLAKTLLARAARETGRAVAHLPHEVLAALAVHSWPGNVRELENEMRRVVLLAEGNVQLDHLSPTVLEGESAASLEGGETMPLVMGDLRHAVEQFERRAIGGALKRAAGNKSRAAKELGISRFALQRKLDKFGMGKGVPEVTG
ncbi:MAG: hypothetical protein CMJ89_07115 [Planctomycetes bacterium]|nr:hypothetical protein [Planctomycetota bacterium]